MLNQNEADTLIHMNKAFTSTKTIQIPPGFDKTYDLVNEDKTEFFLLDIWRGTLRLSKYKKQLRGRKVVVLLRLDINGAPHSNPDGERIGGTHLHIFREGYEDKWAYPLSNKHFSNPSCVEQLLIDFCKYCSISNIPMIQGELL